MDWPLCSHGHASLLVIWRLWVQISVVAGKLSYFQNVIINNGFTQTHLVLVALTCTWSFYCDRHLVLLLWQTLGPFTMTDTWSFHHDRHLVLVALTHTLSLLPWQTLGPCYPDRQLVLVALTDTWPCCPDRQLVLVALSDTLSLLPWQTLGPCCPDRQLVLVALTDTWSWQTLGPFIVTDTWSFYCDRHLFLVALTDTWSFYCDRHLVLLLWQTLGPFTLTDT